MKWFLPLLSVLLLLTAASGCGPRVPTDYDTLAAALENTGAVITTGNTGDKAWVFEVPSRPLTFDGNHLSVFEFPDSGIARNAADRVSADGFFIEMLSPFSEDFPIKQGPAIFDWIAPPHFFLSGRIIVLYVGVDPRVHTLLTTLLGEQFAGAPAP